MRDAVEPTHDAHGIFLYVMGRFIEEKGVSKNFSGSCLLLELSRLHAVDGWLLTGGEYLRTKPLLIQNKTKPRTRNGTLVLVAARISTYLITSCCCWRSGTGEDP